MMALEKKGNQFALNVVIIKTKHVYSSYLQGWTQHRKKKSCVSFFIFKVKSKCPSA